MSRRKKWGLLLLAVLVFVVSTASTCKPYRVKNGVLRDSLFSVEETVNGNWRVFMTHDDVAGYCTTDQALGKKALNLLKEHDGEVVVVFRSIERGDPEYTIWHSKGGCGSVETGSDSSMAMFLLEDIYAVPPR